MRRRRIDLGSDSRVRQRPVGPAQRGGPSRARAPRNKCVSKPDSQRRRFTRSELVAASASQLLAASVAELVAAPASLADAGTQSLRVAGSLPDVTSGRT